jgi:hypothetical protein
MLTMLLSLTLAQPPAIVGELALPDMRWRGWDRRNGGTYRMAARPRSSPATVTQ